MNEPKYISSDDMHQLAMAAVRAENRRLTRQQIESEIELLRLRSECTRLRLLLVKREHEEIDAAHAAWFAGVKARLGIPENAKFGYEPETGLVILEHTEQGI